MKLRVPGRIAPGSNLPSWGAATRRVLARHPALRWCAIAVAALGVGFAVHGQLNELDAQRTAWGQTRQVAVVTGDHSPGDVVAFELIDMPIALVAPSALETVAPNTRTRQHLADGEVLMPIDITRLQGVTALAPNGTTVVAITDPAAAASGSLGHQIAVFAEGITLTANALITHIDGERTYVAVPAGDAALVAHAARTGTASIGFTDAEPASGQPGQ